MIIIKISILYFIQIRHADDFPSTGTRLVYTGMANSVGPSPEDFICVCVYVCVFLCVHVTSSNVELRNCVTRRSITI